MEGRRRDALRRTADGVRRGIRRRRSDRRLRGGRARAHRRSRAATARHRTTSRGTHSGVDEPSPSRRTADVDRQGPPGRPQPAHPTHRRRSHRLEGDGVDGTRARPHREGHAAEPRQHHRGRHDRGQQERDRRARARFAARTQPLHDDRVEGRAPLMRSYEHLLVERHGPVGWLINNRPDQLNAMNAKMRDEFGDAWLELDNDPEVRVIVHTGNGRAFQTGVDVAEIASDGVGMERYRASVEAWDLHFTSWQQHVWKPVITAVNGICAGGGFHWVAEADIVICASDAQFFDPHVSVGQVVSIEAIALLRKMPVEAVMRLAFVGRHERMSATRAYELGMVSEVVDPPEQLRDRAQELAETIAKNSPAAMAATKRALWGALEMGLTDACRNGADELVSMWGHPDQTEGPKAFAEKRDAEWQR